jgi:hypothetical protein
MNQKFMDEPNAKLTAIADVKKMLMYVLFDNE